MTGDEVIDRETYERIKADTLRVVRGTVQADILKEDQAQNTCIFSTEFALGMMGDIQEYFIAWDVRNFYSISISDYHIAEAGANPITQLAFTLANGFTVVEYYLARGMKIDDFAPNLSFFFSYYERKKHDGSLPIIGVNTFVGRDHDGEVTTPVRLVRSTDQEKKRQIANVEAFRRARNGILAGRCRAEDTGTLESLQRAARGRRDMFAALMEAVKFNSLGQISHALYSVGGEYRRNM